jgi:hypothetical protein
MKFTVKKKKKKKKKFKKRSCFWMIMPCRCGPYCRRSETLTIKTLKMETVRISERSAMQLHIDNESLRKMIHTNWMKFKNQMKVTMKKENEDKNREKKMNTTMKYKIRTKKKLLMNMEQNRKIFSGQTHLHCEYPFRHPATIKRTNQNAPFDTVSI